MALGFPMHPIGFKSLRSRLVALEVAFPLLRSRNGKYVLPHVLILPLPFLLLLVKDTSFWWSICSKICFVLMRSASFSLIIPNPASMSMLWKVGWPVSSVPDGCLLLSLLIAALPPGGLDASFF